MTNQNDLPEDDDAPIDLAAEAAAQEAAGGGIETMEDAARVIEALQAELDQAKDRMLRAAAEAENVRRRAEKEKSDAAKYGIANLVKDLLPVADNMQRALAAVPDGEAEQAGEAISGLLMGVRMTEKELLSALERHGVKAVHPKGEKFDPNLHQAIAEVPGNGEPAGIVVDVAQTGFAIGDRVLRAAMVTVSNGAGAPAGGDAPGGTVDTSA